MRLRFSSNYGLIAVVITLLASTSLCAGASAQSLDPATPAPLQAGPNSGTVDNFVGPNYFYVWAGPGKTTITVTYKSTMAIFGSPLQSILTVALLGASQTPMGSMTISSLADSKQQHLSGVLKKKTRLIVALIPQSAAVVRTGGDYEVTATGAVSFDKPFTDTQLIIGTYAPKTLYSDEDNSAAKFLPDGTLQFGGGSTGTWKLFDADTHLYTVAFASENLSLKLIPGRGLVSASDPSSIVFQAVPGTKAAVPSGAPLTQAQADAQNAALARVKAAQQALRNAVTGF